MKKQMRSSDYSSDREQSEQNEGASSRADIQRSLGRIEGQLQAINSSFMQHMQDDAANFKEIKLGMNIMYSKLYTYGGVFLGVGLLLTYSDKLLAFLK